jgi:hypothetical protein
LEGDEVAEEVKIPERAVATPEDAGRTCPYCRCPLKQDGELALCPQCRAAHHADCWADNGGCAVLGCSAAPGKSEASAAPAGSAPAPPQPVAATPASEWFTKFSRDDWIVIAVAVLLAIDLIALPWYSVGNSFYSFTLTATDAPDGWTAVLAFLITLALGADLVIERLAPHAALPTIGGSRTSMRFLFAVASAVFVGLKFLLHIHFSLFGIGFWAAVVLAAALVYSTRRLSRGEGVLPPAVAS